MASIYIGENTKYPHSVYPLYYFFNIIVHNWLFLRQRGDSKPSMTVKSINDESTQGTDVNMSFKESL